MIPIAFDGRRFADLGVSASFPPSGAPGAPQNPIAISRASGDPVYGGMSQGLRTLTVNFTILPASDPNFLDIDIEDIRMLLLGAVNPGSEELRTMVAYRSATDHTEVEIQCATGQYRFPNPNSVNVDFYAADEKWYERIATTLPEIAITGATAIPLYNKGKADVAPVLIFGWDTQRTTENADVGWKYKKTLDVTNTSTDPWNNVRFTFDLGSTLSLVTGGKLLASGNDLRVRRGRRQLARTLTNVNTGRTWCHIFDTIEAGDTATYEFWYGNPDAGSPDTLSVRTINADVYAADDLGGYAGTATAGSTGSLTDGGATWETNEWRYGFIGLISGTGSGRWRRIASNTGTVITFNRLLNTAPDNTTKYILWKSGMFFDGGRVTGGITSTTIQDNAHTNPWGPGSLKGATITFVGGSGATPATNTIIGNTADTITLQTAMSVNPSVGDSYNIQKTGLLQWNVNRGVTERAHRGLWRTNLYHSKGGRVWYAAETPGGWTPWLMLDNQDDFAQGRYVDEGSAGGHAINMWPYDYARRSVRSDNTWPEKKQADGTAFNDSRGILGFDWDYQMKNEGTTPVGVVEVRTQAPDGDTWGTVASDNTTRGTLANVTSSGASGHIDFSADDQIPVRIWKGVLPYDGVEVPSTVRKDYSIELRSHTKHIVYLDLTDCGGLTSGIWTAGSEVAIYDMQPTARIGGGSASVPPYDKIFLGPGLGLETGQELRINAAPEPAAPLFGIYASGALVKRAPWAGRIRHHVLDLDGNDLSKLADRLIPIRPGINLVANEDDIANWTLTNSAGVTAVLSNDTGVTFDGGAQSIKLTITTTPAGAWTSAITYPVIKLVPGALYEWGFVRLRTGLTNAITCSMKVDYTKDAGAAGSDTSQTVGGAMASTTPWYPAGTGKKVFAGDASNGATTEAYITITVAGTGSTSGAINIDPVTFDVPNAYINEDEIGGINFAATWRRCWFG